MELVDFGMLAVALSAVVVCAMILMKVGRLATISWEFNARIAVLKQVAGALPGRPMRGFGIKWSYLWPR